MLDGKRTFLKDACELKGVKYISVIGRARRNHISVERAFGEMVNYSGRDRCEDDKRCG